MKWRVPLSVVVLSFLLVSVASASHFPVSISGAGYPLEAGTASASWSAELWPVWPDPETPYWWDDTVGPGTATLQATVGAGSEGIAGAIYWLDEPVQLGNFLPSGVIANTIGGDTWDPIVGLLIDVDGDGLYEADPAAWQLGFDPGMLGDDSFIQCENAEGFSGPGWMFFGAYWQDGWACYTPNEAGDGYASFYGSYFGFWGDPELPIGRVTQVMDVVGTYAWIGGSLNFDGQVTLFDNFYYSLFSEISELPEGEWIFYVLPLEPPPPAEEACGPGAIAFQALLNGEPTDSIGYGLDTGGVQLPYWSGTAVDAFGRHGMGLIRCLPLGDDYRVLFQVGDGPILVSNSVRATRVPTVIIIEVGDLPEYWGS